MRETREKERGRARMRLGREITPEHLSLEVLAVESREATELVLQGLYAELF